MGGLSTYPAAGIIRSFVYHHPSHSTLSTTAGEAYQLKGEEMDTQGDYTEGAKNM